ncbi:Uncharacterized membrane-anchored protein [Prosthecobacter debontii]|uniref:Uncharacterized membrane-anchored protein n=1 Tax=Prosthecobacter debontii TaxID=48467 RepID=A0A1T4YI23_9BACT|nr:GDYXXLXY domain-containing protein [Prosthecobacter debontii]SKB00941.1 Uncharacterized membrane-anchored protein [Prosthecobacter debontii]
MKNAVVILWALLLLGALNFLIWQKEKTVAEGRTVLLELAPRDPRSLMQGDYMVLRYKLASEIKEAPKASGLLVLKLDDRGVGTGLRLHQDGDLAADEQLLVYRDREGIQIGAESFFFQERQAKLYDNARYGELKVDPNGNSVLIGLRDKDLNLLGVPVIR